MNVETLRRAMQPTHVSGELLAQYLPHFVEAMHAAEITTVQRAAAWYSQVGHESAGLQYMAEIQTSDPDWSWDRTRYRGRGPIQLTWQSNYRSFGQWCTARGYLDNADAELFVDEPGLVEQPRWGFLAASWYWLNAGPRPGQINGFADSGDILAVSRCINGWVDEPNGMRDRRERWNRCLAIGSDLLPDRRPTVEKVLDYPRDQVTQDTFYNCGPASVQTVLRSKGIHLTEQAYAVDLGTDSDGTDSIDLFPAVLNRYVPAAYVAVQMPNDPPFSWQRDQLWHDVVWSIDAGYGVVANIVAPPSNYPRGVKGSVSPAYSGGTVYHYIALMGYSDDGGRAIWVADSGFRPFGYWISLDQLASLIPPKGYAYATAQPPTLEDIMASFADEELSKRFPSRSKYRTNNDPVDTLAGFVLNIDARNHEEYVEREALKGVPWAVDLVKREAAKGDAGAKATLAQIGGK